MSFTEKEYFFILNLILIWKIRTSTRETALTSPQTPPPKKNKQNKQQQQQTQTNKQTKYKQTK